MPHISIPITASGPVLDVIVAVSVPHHNALVSASLPIPKSITIRGLVDTGATCSCIDPAVLKALNLTPKGTVAVVTSTTGNASQSCNQYDVSLLFAYPRLMRKFQAVPVIESNLSAQGFQALIGRDVLAETLLVYDGEAGQVTIAF